MDTRVRIRPFRTEDTPTLIDLFEESIRDIAVRDYSQKQIDAWASARSWLDRLSTGHVLVADVDGDIAGFTRAELSGHIDVLYVHPIFQRQRIASALYHAVRAWALSCGITRLYTDASITARAFFEKHGFRVTRMQEVVSEGVKLTNFRMEREL